jgi:hypothetical protein
MKDRKLLMVFLFDQSNRLHAISGNKNQKTVQEGKRNFLILTLGLVTKRSSPTICTFSPISAVNFA